MIVFSRYPHVGDFLLHYGRSLGRSQLLSVLELGVVSADDAVLLSEFVWDMIDAMATDCEQENVVMGRSDNLDIIPDIDYEVSLYLDKEGFSEVWQRVCDEHE